MCACRVVCVRMNASISTHFLYKFAPAPFILFGPGSYHKTLKRMEELCSGSTQGGGRVSGVGVWGYLELALQRNVLISLGDL